MGRDHTIHAAVAGYVKYYRDPQRHPKRQYIGVVFNREDKLPYPVSTPRRRKLHLVAVPRKTETPVPETAAPSGIPLSVTRREEIKGAVEAEKVTAAQTSAKSGEPIPLKDGNSIIASLVKEKLVSRQMAQAKREARNLEQQQELEARKATRVFRLQSDYSYRESNWEIGRIVGDAGTIPGAKNTESRKAKFRLRRRKRMVHFRGIKSRQVLKAARRKEYQTRWWENKAQRNEQKAEARRAEQAAQPKVEA